MANFWSAVTIDCSEPARVAEFWSKLLDLKPGPSQPGWVYLGERGDVRPRLVFQPVPEPKRGKTRIHLDVTTDDIDDGIGEILSLGGSHTGERYEYDEGIVVIMSDVEGNEFCLIQYF